MSKPAPSAHMHITCARAFVSRTKLEHIARNANKKRRARASEINNRIRACLVFFICINVSKRYGWCSSDSIGL